MQHHLASVVKSTLQGRLDVDNQFKADLENLSRRKMSELGDDPLRHRLRSPPARLPLGHQGARCHLLVCVTSPCCEKLLLW